MTQGIRPDGQIFASDASDGELESFPAPARGWGVTIDGKDEAGNVVADATNGIPPMEWDNGQRNKVDNNIWWLMQHAIPEWQAGNWDAGAFVRYNDVVYYNATDAETAGEPGDSADWSAVLPLNGTDGRYLQTGNNLSEIAAKGADAQTAARNNLGIDMFGFIQIIYPVGAVIINSGTNPVDYLKFGSWQQRSGLIGGIGTAPTVDGASVDLNAGQNGNAYITEANMTTQSHSIASGITDSIGAHTHNEYVQGTSIAGANTIIGADARSITDRYSSVASGSAGEHSHSVSGNISFGTNSAAYLPAYYGFCVWQRVS